MHACFFIHSLGGYALSFPFLLSLHEEGLKNYGKIHTNLTTVTIFFFCFLGLRLWHMEIPRLGIVSELQLPAYTTATATWDQSRVCNLHHSLWQCPLSEAGGGLNPYPHGY